MLSPQAKRLAWMRARFLERFRSSRLSFVSWSRQMRSRERPREPARQRPELALDSGSAPRVRAGFGASRGPTRARPLSRSLRITGRLGQWMSGHQLRALVYLGAVALLSLCIRTTLCVGHHRYRTHPSSPPQMNTIEPTAVAQRPPTGVRCSCRGPSPAPDDSLAARGSPVPPWPVKTFPAQQPPFETFPIRQSSAITRIVTPCQFCGKTTKRRGRRLTK